MKDGTDFTVAYSQSFRTSINLLVKKIALLSHFVYIYIYKIIMYVNFYSRTLHPTAPVESGSQSPT